MENFKRFLEDYSKKITHEILTLKELKSENKTILDHAIRYVLEVGGKRLRPILVLELSKIFEVDYNYAIRVASSVELIHCYSLVHDDLPAMDNDDLRRGNPTCHIKFNESTAILVGDALQSSAYEILSDKKTHPSSDVRCKLINELTKSSGLKGMVGGQQMDLEAEKKRLQIKDIRLLQQLKTGELFRFSCVASSILAQNEKKYYEILEKFSINLGLAFQIKDDLLDIEGKEENVGKKVNKDFSKGKQTFISNYGVEKARRKAENLIDEAIDLINNFSKKDDVLENIVRLIINRSS